MNDDELHFEEFCKNLNFEIPYSMRSSSLIIQETSDNKTFNFLLNFNFSNLVDIEDLKNFIKILGKNKESMKNTSVFFNFSNEQYEIKNILIYIKKIISKPKYKTLFTFDFDKKFEKKNDNTYSFILNDDFYNEEVIKAIKHLENKFYKLGLTKVKFIYKKESGNSDTKITVNTENNNGSEIVKKLKNNPEINNDLSSKKEFVLSKNNKKNEYEYYKLRDLEDYYHDLNVQIEGLIFSIEHKELINSKKNKHLYILNITDYDSGIQVQMFKENELNEEEKKIFKINNWVKFFGRYTQKIAFGKPLNVVYLDNYVKGNGPIVLKKDNLSKKRIELHVSSKMNTMDGLMQPDEIIDSSIELGMNAVAIMDTNGCQGYPKFYNHSLKCPDFKPLYGTAFSVISNKFNTILGTFKNQNLRNASYVSFDIETSSLLARFGDIIEFGSVEINNLRVENKEQFFIKPNKPINKFTSNLTGISNSMLENGLEINEALDRIYEILNNKIALAHNAKFDFNFIKQKFYQQGKEFPNFAVIDTLKVSRLLFPNENRHRLKNLADRLEIKYDEEVAHRGDYDAKVLGEIWCQLIISLEKIGIYDLNQLSNYVNDALIKREFSYEISTLAKNNRGLKDQFDLVSELLTNKFSIESPKIFFDKVREKENILIGSGTLKSKLIEDYFYSSHEEFLKTIDMFDYIEIPAPQVFSHWIAYGDITEEELNNALKEIILVAKNKGKIVVATGDVKYKSELDKKAYEIVVYAKGIGKARHFLYSYERAKNNTLKIPNQYFLNTLEMLEQFSFLNDKELINEIVIENTHKIANMCENIQVIKKDLFKPEFDNSEIKLKELVYKTAREKYGVVLPKFIEERIKAELDPIINHGFSVIYWISHVLIKESIENGYVVGSRGSVGSSITAYLSGVSEVNPLPAHYICKNCKYFEITKDEKISSGFDLDPKKCPRCSEILDTDGHTIPFETFLGFDADKVPDIDLNFSGDIQPKIHDKVRMLFGPNNTFKAGTVQTVAEKTAFGYVKAYFEEKNEVANDIYMNYLANKIMDLKRTTGQHPGGIIIVPKEYSIFDFTPINYPANDIQADWKTTHFDYKAIHDNLLKLDILGHDNPTIIKFLESKTGVKTHQIPKKDKNLIKLFSSPEPLGIKSEDIMGEVTGALGIPEFGTSFVRRMLASSKPKSFADLISLSGLSHGESVWTGNAEELVVKHNFNLSEVISCRDDILVNLLKIEGIDRKKAFKIMENVRKGKGLTSTEENYLLEHNVPNWQIESMKKIKYMFPKAHATAYVLMAWWIAYYKLNFPLEFYASYLSIRPDNYDLESMIDEKGGSKVKNKLMQLYKLDKSKEIKETDKKMIPMFEIIQEMYARGFNISNIDLKKSLATEWIIDNENKCLIPPFNAVSQLGEAIANSIVKARNQKEFISTEDFNKRTGINRTLLNKLKTMGIFDELDDTNQMTLF
ncbi:DNA polymerase III alpha subunit [Mycoplasmopsis meleagridis]|uniref:DNA polymerase III PolC-type n=1 Tax=Mycoplasmopsis meleagridis ATCC 25294 TaxID=1264554 RepID=A0A0F5H1I8_9BACT|nr:PolC-type DNA polymerase III [Mycoplasmopsis meleagridis]KKB26727.1 DNA polymerase III alpha subunit [Mycoplasmopsis meleagridis ATCC 25294]OAD18157.1 DNA polymerase III alpha subunit [Mycoplasmopsis meleagridis]VEU77260.1 DNA polymerase III polC-type [Mycoplasmopsis meleagridis]